MLKTGVFRGRPFGGIGVLVNRSLAKGTSLVVNSERLIIVMVGSVYVANVYLPDSSNSSRDEIVSDICSQIESHVDFNSNNTVIIGGDFNLEFLNDTSCCKDLNSFLLDNDLCVCDTKFTTDIDYTYFNETHNCFSWIDHFITSRSLFDKVTNARIVDLGSNLSDHCPIWMHIGDVDGFVKNAGTSSKSTSPTVSRLRWDKADVLSYYELTRSFFNDFSFSSDIDSDYDKILTALHNSARLSVPRGQATFFQHYWDDDLNDLKLKSVEAHRLWVECGWPRAGFVLQERCRTKAAYKRAVRNKWREGDLTVSNDLHDCLLSKDIDGFWRTWK